MDVQVAELAQDGRRLVAVTLELDDDEAVHRALPACGDVVETQVGVDGETLSLGLVHQRDAVETVLYLFGETLWVILQMGTQERIVVDEVLILTMELNVVLRVEGVEQIENRFDRITLVNKAKTERLTIDTHLRFNNIATGEQRAMGDLVIIELKRDGNQPSPILGKLCDLHIHPHGFSKYCIGSALTNDSLRRNRIKPRLRSIQKILGK